jgi:hypothetical protein
MTNKRKVVPDEPLPQHLEHKPVYAMPYQFFDGLSKGNTDGRYLSVGLAQWNQNDVSIKVMRHTGERWTRQAEELPLHRAIDMTLFLANALAASNEGTIHIPAGSFSNQDEELTVRRDPHRTAVEKAQFEAFMAQNEQHLKQRLNTLADLLLKLRANGKL